ncbi:MAG: AbrB/MazE/SpoVT family DNA-binding domain-containing protein [Planctomycetia bacterium]|nr:MAG: AbrB/MazE/SpoVT family DNA-binding domain-containing protein [Planctomycetia bacterium]HQU32645.1 AbrB/MazE/SpoVT family DNA-binding domain-containing protein [Candidatus Brocadia sapporoensis]
MSLLKLRKFAQITLPADLRKKFNLTEGDFLEAEAVEKGILLKPVTVVEREKTWNQLFETMKKVKDRKSKQKQGVKEQEEEIAKMVKNFRKQHA